MDVAPAAQQTSAAAYMDVAPAAQQTSAAAYMDVESFDDGFESDDSR